MLDSTTLMSNGEYMIFCKDFGIPITRDRALSVFNKVSEFRKPIDINQFVVSIEKLAIELNEFNKDAL